MSVPNLDVAIPRDDLDDLLDSNLGGDDAFRELDTNMDVPELPPPRSRPTNTTTGAADLGIDSEIKITKQRRPIAKLDEKRLLSANGIPKLRRITKERLKFKGKGHEFSDMARLLNLYQLWLDDLFPKAKFADGLALIEKAGHSKRMQTMRREWIDEGKPRDRDEECRWEAVKAHDAKLQKAGDAEPSPRMRESSVPASKATPSEVVMSGALNGEPHEKEKLFVSEDEGGAPHSRPTTQTVSKISEQANESLFVSDDDEAPKASAEEEPDDLDALLAEDEARQKEQSNGPPTKPSNPQIRIHDEFDDEMDALLAEDEEARQKEQSNGAPTKQSNPQTRIHDEFDDEMDAMAGLDDW